MSLESVNDAKNNDYNPTIEFKRDGTFNIIPDVNICFGDFELTGETDININNGGCTEVCCDSDFSLKFIIMLSEVNSYEIKGDILKLNVSDWGWIVLQHLSD